MTTFHDAHNERGRIEFLATLAHELRNRLQAILSAASIVEAQATCSHVGASPAAIIKRQVNQLLCLVDDLLDVGQWTVGTLRVRKERTNLVGVVSMAVETCQPVIIAEAHRLVLRLPPQPVYVNADPLRLGQVFVNLLDNSAKYSDRCGRIMVTVERDIADAIIRIEDDGIGIPAELLPNVFDLFVRANQPLEKPRGGLGIGLSLVKRIVELHSGTVEARSIGPGCGSVFTVRLPAESS